MYPELLHIGPFTLHSFGLMMALAFVTAGVVTAWGFRRRGIDPTYAYTLLLGSIVGGIVGAKVHYLLVHPSEFPGNVFSGEGLIWYGGLFGGIAGVWVAAWLSPLRYGVVADCVAPGLALAYAVGRIGCFLRGDDYGLPSNLPWAMAFPEGAPPTDVPVHPTQLYESLASVVIFALLVWVFAPRLTRASALFWTYLVLAGVERFAVEFVRTNNAVLAGLTQAQLTSLGLIVVGVVGLLWVYARPAPAPGVYRPGRAPAGSTRAAAKKSAHRQTGRR